MNLQGLPLDVLVSIIYFLPPKTVLAFGMTTKELKDSPMWSMYCKQKRLGTETGKITNSWKMVQRVAHVPHHVLDAHAYLLIDYEDDVTLHAKRKQWIKIFGKWNKYATKKRSFIRAAIVQGVPMSVRATFWKMCLQLHSFPPVNFQELTVSSECREDISRYLDLDYHRICRSASKSAYRNVLRALSAYDKDILYTPAMGILATMLLNYLDEEDAFRALATLMHGKYALKGMFVEGLPKLHLEGKNFKFLFEKLFPKLYPKCSMVVDHILAIPMLGIFTSLHPNVGMDKIWDMIMFDGYDLILCVLLALLEIHEEKFQIGNEEEIFTSFIRLGTVEDVLTNKLTKSNINNNNNNNENTPNNVIKSGNKSNTCGKGNKKKVDGGLGVEVVSVGDVIRMDRILDLAFKYHKKVAPKLAQLKLEEL